ncbi:YwgA family protein [Salicibibacter kimchii]|uniref:YwgA family protein n=1 Tax=Salicibibacter kimchii TaxID=2099786 RepID=A0A345BWF1_9BACI|nr:hypothetical protein [Salicibibacter kimchii]AXF55282.1 hypothetical protein DT065_04100 [Salicibibacter kimchii]
MFAKQYRLLALVDALGKIKGRKKLQKIVHLLEHSGTDFFSKYEYHHYGPYSSDLQMEVNDLYDQGFLDESMENETYCYSITERGKVFKSKLEQKSQNDVRFNFPSEHASNMNEKSSQFLEVVSTYAYLLDTGYQTSDAYDKTNELKPHLKHLLNQAVEYYNYQLLRE